MNAYKTMVDAVIPVIIPFLAISVHVQVIKQLMSINVHVSVCPTMFALKMSI